MEIRIKPLDTLFFRDGKPFTMGEETWADSNMLPSPSVIYGALRTAIATHTDNPIDFDKLANNSELGKDVFAIKSISYNADGRNVLPLPLDLVEYEKEKHIIKAEEKAKAYEVRPLLAKDLSAFKAVLSKSKDFVTTVLLSEGLEQVDTLDNGLMLMTEFEKYLLGGLTDNKTAALKLTDWIKSEPKLGIGREDITKTADEGSLYRTDLKRMVLWEINVNFDLKDNKNLSHLVRLGGEGKLIHLSAKLRPTKIANAVIAFDKQFKIYFATPAILKNGQPDVSRLGIEAQLVTACVGKPLSIGGFDMKNNKAKPMYKTVPAGSVFYYSSADDLSTLNNQQGVSLSDEQAEQGFGIAYFGTWKTATNND